MLSKKHYEAIAEIISDSDSHNPVDPDFAEGWFAAVANIRVRLGLLFADENENFDMTTFNRACRGRN